ncbi:peptidase M28-like protein [Gelidibacter algens]|uniref:Peptidase M28-like protein n=1 Tax=Gelidibacter algens TaxID=49280 RepID=A0A1A7R0N2_9FLAO|nr:M20/M25/M40 family metallo-hydrolase [Gelidibacter algens]OBX25810.1 peptidase M28 [Gelidibacter algens]RAJ19125.1 peptidase M28-like protein [Gelidibacter algens]
MKHILFITVLLAMVSCKTKIQESPETNTINLAMTEQIPANKTLEFVTSAELKESVSYLASDDLQGRATGSAGIEKAAVYIENKLKSYNVKPYFETYRDFYKAKGMEAYNVVGFIEGNDPELKKEIIIIGAHYDHIGFGEEVDGDTIANGANDDATGVAAVLAMARYFATKKNNKRSILFTLYSGEEMGLLGSKHLAARLKEQDINLYTMINFEMIGVPMVDKEYDAYFTGFDLSNMAPKMNDYVDYNLLGLLPKAKEFQLFYRSDNYPFYKAFNKPSHAISTFDFTNFDHYHKVGDEADKMDYEFMADLVNRLIPAFETMSNTATQEIKMNE